MALPRFSSLGRSSFLSRPWSSSSSSSPPAGFFSQKSTHGGGTTRAFTSCSRRLFEAQATPLGTLSEEEMARSIIVLKINRRATKKEVEDVFRKEGLEITKSQFRLDRFTLHNDTYFHATLATPDQAKTAIEKLDKTSPFGPLHIVVQIRKHNTVEYGGDRWIYHENRDSIVKALLAIKEDRRVQICVKTPAWEPHFEERPKSLNAARKNYARDLLLKTFDRFGVEALGGIGNNSGQMLLDPKFLCHVDFKTKQGAEDAIQSLHNTELEGKLIWLKKTVLNELRAQQIGRVDMSVLEEFQALGLAPPVDFEKKF
ncbi:hypothetical protein K504DRAFT_467237 [Pleomassaria siparia CBS 279.74]|uniref:RRM domain-containing protein n=1 Tax=Pleomassaria siparia CBS 279.74 TaxID=1314801 RepID=A0A6G1KA02_9PLEO|nr:hypothetical protein K504DRAFT_467237 [Pleomassaria siparia CBS 279.74]